MRVNTKLVVVNYPHNPTGYVPPREDFEAVVRLVKGRGVLEKFEFVHPDSKRFKPHGTRMNEMLLYLQVDIFCHDMIMAVEQWLQDVDTNPAKKRLLEELSAIYYYFLTH